MRAGPGTGGTGRRGRPCWRVRPRSFPGLSPALRNVSGVLLGFRARPALPGGPGLRRERFRLLNFSGSLVSAPPVFFAGLGQGRALGCRLQPHTAAAFENAALWLGDGGEVVFKWVSFRAFSPLPQLPCVLGVEASRLFTVSRATHYTVYQTLPGCPGENQETSSKNLNVSCRQ